MGSKKDPKKIPKASAQASSILQVAISNETVASYLDTVTQNLLVMPQLPHYRHFAVALLRIFLPH